MFNLQLSVINNLPFFVGLSIAISFGSALFFGLSSGPMFLDRLSCVGKESALLSCRAYTLGLAQCDNTQAAGVHCTGNLTRIISSKKIAMKCFLFSHSFYLIPICK